MVVRYLVATAIFCLAVGLLSFVGLPVTSLRFPVNPVFSQVAACVRTIGLASKAPAAYAEHQTAEAAADLHQKQKKWPPTLQTVRSHGKNEVICGASDRLRSSPQSPELALRAFLYSFKKANR
jgi:hypothetical protein